MVRSLPPVHSIKGQRPTGERASAVEWAVRAGREAVRSLAYEEGARLFQLALDIGDPDLGWSHRVTAEGSFRVSVYAGTAESAVQRPFPCPVR